MLAYLDDVYAMGSQEFVMLLFDDLKTSLKDIGQDVRDDKCKLYCPSADSGSTTIIPVAVHGIEVLGTPIGTSNYVESKCEAKAEDGNTLCSILRDLDEPQSALLLLKHCHVPKLNHLARTVVPTHLSKAAVIHDNLTKSTFADIIGLEQIEDTKWKQATMKLKFGGFGLTLYQQLLPAAFVAAWVQSLKELPNRFSTFQDLRQKFLTPCSEVSAIGYSLQKSVECLPPRMNDGQCHYRTLEDMMLNPRKLQHHLKVDIAEKQSAEHMENLKSDNDAAILRIRSLTGHGAGAWLETIPTTDKHALKPNEFRLASHLRMGNSLPFNQWLKTCDCGKDLDKHGYHLLTCKYGGPVWTHDTVTSAWSDCLSDLHIHHQKEPRHRYADTENRPDIVFYDIATRSTKEL